jgi:signal transduction histidine kinase
MYTDNAPPAQDLFSPLRPQLKETLLVNLAHELRQPLSTIESIAYYLELSLPQADPRVKEQLTRVRQMVEQSGWMIEDALAIESGVETRPEIVDLDEIVTEYVLEQWQQEGSRGGWNLDLSASPVLFDVRQGQRMVRAVMRLMRELAMTGTAAGIATRSLPGGVVLLRAWCAGSGGEDLEWPAGAQLTLDCIERLAERNAASVFRNLLKPARLELLIEIPAAPLAMTAEPARLEVLAAFGEAAPTEPAAPNTP